jgi:hypothetical protein
MAKLLAYADCSIIQLTNADPHFCDCNRIVDTDAIPVAPDQPDKQKELSLKADWKYVGVSLFRFANSFILIDKAKRGESFLYIPQQSLQAVFHPPKS